MKNKLWNTKNSFTSKTISEKENLINKDSFVFGHRATFSSHLGKEQTTTVSHQDDILQSKESKFSQLKQEIKCLQNSQFLSLKYRCNTEPDTVQDTPPRVNGKEFMPSKKLAQLEKFKMHLRRKGKGRKVSVLLDRNKHEQGKDTSNFLNFLEVKDLNPNGKDPNIKRKQTPSIVKKYYRPQTGNTHHRSMSQLTTRETEVRGRGLKSSTTNRLTQKENTLIYCY